MDISSHVIQRTLGLPPPATRDLVIERDLPVPMADGAVLLADRWAPGRRRGAADRAAPYPVRQAGAVRRGDGQAAGRTRVPGADPEHPGHVRLRWDLRRHAVRARRRPGHPAVAGEAALVRRGDHPVRRQLPGLRAMGGGRWPAARGQGDDPAGDGVGADAGVPAPGRLFAGDAVRLGSDGRGPGAPLGDAAGGRAGQADAPGPGHAPARPGRCRGHRAPFGLHPGHPGLRLRAPRAGPGSTTGTGWPR